MSDSHLYGDQEIRAILKRAAERQHLDLEQPAAHEGLTLEELQQVAAEAGIAPQHVEAAVADMTRTPPEAEGFQIWGAPGHVERERVIEGSMSQAAWEEMAAALQQAYNGAGEVRQVGRTREWAQGDRVLVSIAEREQGTRIRLSSTYSAQAVVTHAPLLTVGLILALTAVGTIESWLLAPLAFVAIIGVFYAAARAFFRYLARFQRDKADDAMRRLEAIAAQHHIASPASEVAAAEAAGTTTSPDRVDLPEQAPPTAEPEAPTRSRTRSS